MHCLGCAWAARLARGMGRNGIMTAYRTLRPSGPRQTHPPPSHRGAGASPRSILNLFSSAHCRQKSLGVVRRGTAWHGGARRGVPVREVPLKSCKVWAQQEIAGPGAGALSRTGVARPPSRPPRGGRATLGAGLLAVKQGGENKT